MFNQFNLPHQYQIRNIGCNTKVKLAANLLATYGYTQAVHVCRKNHWTGIIKTINILKGS
ncbi:MAG: hypothetical protein JKY04_06690 [Sneathiella sp.]|nr:hypothetical protein [Sneathiella sp.]